MFSWFWKPKPSQEPPFSDGLALFSEFLKNNCKQGPDEYVPLDIFIAAFANYLKHSDRKEKTPLNYCYPIYAKNYIMFFLKQSNIQWSLSPGFSSELSTTKVLIGVSVKTFRT